MNKIKDMNLGAWLNDSYVRQAYKELGLNYDSQLNSLAGYGVSGKDPLCKTAVAKPAEAGEIWVTDGDIVPFSSPACTLAGVKKYTSEGKKLNAVYLFDRALGIKVFADAAFYAVATKDPAKPEVVPFLLKRDAEQYAKKVGGKLATYQEALAVVPADIR
jgi:NitT/TauT family transport system substrate-binding protein